MVVDVNLDLHRERYSGCEVNGNFGNCLACHAALRCAFVRLGPPGNRHSDFAFGAVGGCDPDIAAETSDISKISAVGVR